MSTSVARLSPSITEWRVPYLLSNLDLVTESLTLIAGKSSSPDSASWYSRCTPVVVSSVTPLRRSATVRHLCGSASMVVRTRALKTLNSSESSSVVGGTWPAFSHSTPWCTSIVASPPSSRIMLGPSPSVQVRILSVQAQ